MITLIVGKKRKKYHLHKDLLRAKSAYFEAMFSSTLDWKEGKENEVIWKDELTEDIDKAVEIWVNWLYGQTMSTDHNWAVMLQCYKLGHQRAMHDFQNHVLDTFRPLFIQNKWFCTPNTLMECLDLEILDTPMYNLLLRSWVHTAMTCTNLKEEKNKASVENFIKMMGIA